MTKRYEVTDEQERKFHKRRRELENRFVKGLVDPEATNDALQYLIEDKRVKLIIDAKHMHVVKPNDPFDMVNILFRERFCHQAFFGNTFDLSDFETTLKKYGESKIRFWAKLGLEPHFLPKVMMMKEDNFPGWKIKPNDWFYNQIAQGKIFRQINGESKIDRYVALEGITVLIDTRLKPSYDNGGQMWTNDSLLGSIVANLRKQGKIERYSYDPQTSRFGVSADEWENTIKPVYAAKPNLNTNQLRLERAIEANVIPQIYTHMPRKDDGTTNTWVWYEEYSEDRDNRLSGGDSGNGGLAGVDLDDSDNCWSHESFRPLAVL